MNSLVKKVVTYDTTNKKRFSANSGNYRFLGKQHKDCYTPTYEWNMTSSQRVLFDVESTSPIDYFSLIVFGKDLVKMWLSQELVIKARIERPRKQCVIEKFESMDQISDKTQISFKCFQNSESVSLNDLNPSNSEIIKLISMEIESKKTILVKYCSLKTYSFPEFCGSPEKPLHSMNLIEEKSSVVFSCEVDFYLEPIDSQNVKCGPLGDWNRPFPRCVAKSTCHLPALSLSDHFIHVEYKDLNYLNGTPYAESGSVAIYSCGSRNNTHIELIGDNTRVCHKGFWSGFQPKCSQKSNYS